MGVLCPSRDGFNYIEVVSSGIVEGTGVLREYRQPMASKLTKFLALGPVSSGIQT